jgi:hypothetical protein
MGGDDRAMRFEDLRILDLRILKDLRIYLRI